MSHMDKDKNYHIDLYKKAIDNIEKELKIGNFSHEQAQSLKANALGELTQRLALAEDIPVNQNDYLNNLNIEEDYNMVGNFAEFSADLENVLINTYGDNIEEGIYELAGVAGIHPEVIIGYLEGDLDITEEEFYELTDMLNQGLMCLDEMYSQGDYFDDDDYLDETYLNDDDEYLEDENEYYPSNYNYHEAPESYSVATPSYSAYYEDAMDETIAEFSGHIALLQDQIENLQGQLDAQYSTAEIAAYLDDLLNRSEDLLENGWMTPAQQEAIFSPDLVFADPQEQVAIFLQLTNAKGSNPYQELEQINDHLEILSYTGFSAREALMEESAEFAEVSEIGFLEEIFPGLSDKLKKDPTALWDIN